MTTNGAIVLPESVVHGAFKGMLGKTFNFVHFKEAIGKLDGWYSEHGVLGQVSQVIIAASQHLAVRHAAL